MHEDTENGLHPEAEKRLLCRRPPDWKARRRSSTISDSAKSDDCQKMRGALPMAGSSAVSEKEPLRKLTMDVRKLSMDEASPTDPLAGYEKVVREARCRVWDADVARHYAHRRHMQSGAETDRRLWLARSRESDRALMELEEAERALDLARRPRTASAGSHGS